MGRTLIERRRPLLPKWLRGEGALFYAFISPWLIGFVVFTAGPMVYSLYLSFTVYNILTPPEWVGLANYELMLAGDQLFWRSLGVTFTYALFHIPLTILIALAAAMLLNLKLPGMYAFRTIFFVPTILPAAASAILWWFIFNRDYGLLNIVLGLSGERAIPWLERSDTALWAIIVIGLWGFGYTMVIFLAGLQNVPAALYEAAAIDGAGWWPRFRHVTLPLISPVVFFNVITGTIATFQVFTPAFVITQGGPAHATLFFMLYLYQNAFKYLKTGYASSMAWAIFLIILALTAFNFRVGRSRVHYGG